MKTLVIISHPDYQQSMGQQFLKESSQQLTDVTLHHLDQHYPTGQVDVAQEIQLLKEHDRIIFQFPLYWYSSPGLLKSWQDQVLSALPSQGLREKELGLVVSVGVKASAYRSGGSVGFSLDDFMRPFQGIATYFHMTYLPVMGIYQFNYLSESDKLALLVDYQYYLTGPKENNLGNRAAWLTRNLAEKDGLDPSKTQLLMAHIHEQMETIEELKLTIDEMES